MKMRLKVAFRNITRHRLRSLLSICMISGAVTSMIIFRGFSQYTLDAIKKIAAENQFGHMQIAKEKFWNPGTEGRKERMYDSSELVKLKDSHPELDNISGRLSFFGLVSNGDLSIGAKVVGVDTINETSFSESMRILDGKFFISTDSKEAMIGALLAKQMNVKPGDNIVILTNTIDGVMNAMDISVTGIFSAGIDEIDAQVIYLPLKTAQQILDTANVDVAVLKFKKLEMAEPLAYKMDSDAKKIIPDLQVKTWRELAQFFKQVDAFFGMQNRIIEGILLALMFLGILNTVSMTVVERTGEIGTLRSLGESRKDIVKQFLLESILVALISILVGLIFSVIVIQFIHMSNIMTDMPGASVPFQVRVIFMASSVIYSSFLAIVTTAIATLIPAIRASKMDIVSALRKNI
jgi:putative ABC transport system permease protein